MLSVEAWEIVEAHTAIAPPLPPYLAKLKQRSGAEAKAVIRSSSPKVCKGGQRRDVALFWLQTLSVYYYTPSWCSMSLSNDSAGLIIARHSGTPARAVEVATELRNRYR